MQYKVTEIILGIGKKSHNFFDIFFCPKNLKIVKMRWGFWENRNFRFSKMMFLMRKVTSEASLKVVEVSKNISIFHVFFSILGPFFEDFGEISVPQIPDFPDFPEIRPSLVIIIFELKRS